MMLRLTFVVFLVLAVAIAWYVHFNSEISLYVEASAFDQTYEIEYDGAPPKFSDSEYNLEIRTWDRNHKEILGSEKLYTIACLGKSDQILQKRAAGFVFSAQGFSSCYPGAGSCISPVRFHFIVNMKCPKRTVKVRLTQDEKVLSERKLDFEIN